MSGHFLFFFKELNSQSLLFKCASFNPQHSTSFFPFISQGVCEATIQNLPNAAIFQQDLDLQTGFDNQT